MIELRCPNPHPRIPGKPCNALHRFLVMAGGVSFECWRCHGEISYWADSEGTESSLTTITA